MKLVYIYVSFILLLLCRILYGQTDNTAPQNFIAGSKEISPSDNFRSKEDYLRAAIKTNPEPELLFELAKICNNKNTISGRSEARELLTRAIFRSPRNLEYRYLLAEILQKISSGLAYGIYEDILKIDSTSPKALYNLGKIEESKFDDYHNSVHKDGDEPTMSLERFAIEDFNKAEKYLINAIRYDSLYRDAYLHLSFLYEDNNEPEKGIVYLKRLEKIYPSDNEVHVYLGLLYYESSQIEKSLKEYQLALSLMPDSLRQDFTFNSVKELIKPIFGEKFEKLPYNELKELINIFWKITDPLYITDYNERLLEHYSRVAYANLRFSIIDKDIPGYHLKLAGWKTDRGEIILRYGAPLKKVRFRPQINAGGSTVINMKTDVWYYKYFTLGFTDQFSNNNFVYSEVMPGSMYIPQFGGDSQMLVNYLRKVQYQTYTPKFDGPTIDVPYNIVQFRDNRYNYTDVYVNYALDAPDSLRHGNEFYYKHEWGLFFSDTVFNSIVEKKGWIENINADRKINIAPGNDFLINTLFMSIYPEPGNIAFELERSIDKGVFTNHSEFDPKKFHLNSPDISDVVLASAIKHDTLGSLSLKRKNISLLPNPINTFNAMKPFYVYYELYNFSRDKNGLTSIEQKLILKRKVHSSGISSVINSALSVVGLGKQKEEVTIITKYQTAEEDPQITFQLDMHNYLPGDYNITINITDELSGKEISKEVSLILK
jgi:GWxTD domain-containing protein